MKPAKTLSLSLAAIALAGSVQAGSLSIDGYTIGTTTNTNVTAAPAPIPTGTKIATGFEASFGAEAFIAWCLDLQHTVSAGGPYQYMVTDSPFSNSFLAPGAAGRVQSLFDANYKSVDAYDAVDAAAFQLGLWEVAYDSDFDLGTGDFKGAGFGSDAAAITTAAMGYLTAASGYLGGQKFNVRFLENADQTTRQNLVTASAVPIPAAGVLLLTGAAGLGVLRRFRRG